MSERVERLGDSAILYDDDLVNHADANVFDPAEARDSSSASTLAGRGQTRVIDIEGRRCVLRHYYRGGMIRHLSKDRFFWAGEMRTRSFSEWRLLAELRERGLPVPRPVAARYVRGGPFYTADLITEFLPDVRSLAATVNRRRMEAGSWRAIGAMLASFHRHHVFHADLNAHNIQVGRDGRLFLLDFDRGRIMNASGSWSDRNLQRLRRSLDKITRLDGAHFDDADWRSLLDGYRG